MAGRYGDAILMTRLLRQLRAAIPDVSLHVIVSRKTNSVFFRSSPYVTSVFCLKSGLGEWLRFFISSRFDVLFNPKDSPSNSNLILSTFLKARLKVSHYHELHEGIFDRLIDLDHFSHVTVQNAGLLDVLGLEVPESADIRPELPVYQLSGEVAEFAEKIRGQGYAGINLSAGNASRYWTGEKWSQFAKMFPAERFVIFSSPEDVEEKKHLEFSLGNVIASPVTANLGEVGAILGHLKVLVSPDTSLVHMAACFDTPVIALFPDDLLSMKRYAPLSTRSAIVASATCRVGDISVDAVAGAFRKLMDQHSRSIQ